MCLPISACSTLIYWTEMYSMNSTSRRITLKPFHKTSDSIHKPHAMTQLLYKKPKQCGIHLPAGDTETYNFLDPPLHLVPGDCEWQLCLASIWQSLNTEHSPGPVAIHQVVSTADIDHRHHVIPYKPAPPSHTRTHTHTHNLKVKGS